MRSRPDFALRSTWATLFRQVALMFPGEVDRDGPPPLVPFAADDPSIAAWQAAMHPLDPSALGALLEILDPRPDPSSSPMIAPRADLAVEVWVECELSVLHAAWRLLLHAPAEADHVPGTRDRLARAVRWHLERTQPDNATTRPWGIHAVLELGAPWIEASDYAASMIHAVEAAGHARSAIDPLSAWILLDAAEGVERGGAAVRFDSASVD